MGEHLGTLLRENAAGLLADSLKWIERAADDAPKTEAYAPTGPSDSAIALILLAHP